MPSTRTPCGINLTSSPDVEDGTWAYSKGGRIVGVSTQEGRVFLAKFGLRSGVPQDFDTITFSQRDYLEFVEKPREVKFG